MYVIIIIIICGRKNDIQLANFFDFLQTFFFFTNQNKARARRKINSIQFQNGFILEVEIFVRRTKSNSLNYSDKHETGDKRHVRDKRHVLWFKLTRIRSVRIELNCLFSNNTKKRFTLTVQTKCKEKF